MVKQFPTEQHYVATELQAQPLSTLPLCVTNVTLIRVWSDPACRYYCALGDTTERCNISKLFTLLAL